MSQRRAGQCLRVALSLLLLWLPGARATAENSVPDVAIAQELHRLSSHAATAFVGQITSIQRKAGLVEVRFRVDQPVRGDVPSRFVLREWAGLWPPESSRYVVGQRVLAFLYGTGRTGLSSPVLGQEGLVPVAVQGADAPALLDIRRLAASVVRSPGTPLPTEANGAIPLDVALRLVTGSGPVDETALGRCPLPGTHAVAAGVFARRHTPAHSPAGPSQQAMQERGGPADATR